MKILITVSTYYPRKDGVQNVTGYLSEGLAKKGHDVTVITTNKGVNNVSEIHNGVKIKRVKLYTKFGLYFGNKKEYVKIIDDLVKDCDVMINVCTQNAFTDLLVKRIYKYNCKKVLYLHGIFDFRFHLLDFNSLTGIVNKLWKEIRWFFYYKSKGKFFKKYDLITQLHEKDYANTFFKKKYGIDSLIIENAADNDFFVKKTNKSFKKPFEKYLILVANYDDRKNQKLAIDEFLKCKISNKIGLVLIGSEKNSYYCMLEKRIKKLKQKYNLSSKEKPILMLYGVDRNLISSYVSNAYLYIMTSKWEAYPISLVESVACGVPFISTNVGIVKYFFGGIVTNKKDIHYWIERLINNETMRNSLSEICINYANQSLRIDDKVDMLEKIINNN